MAIFLVFISSLTITAYRSVPIQTDDSPYFTSIGERVGEHGAAISQELLCPICKKLHKRCNEADKEQGAVVHYHDLVYIEGVGFKFVNDVMNKRHRKRMDVWVNTEYEEGKIFTNFKNKKVTAYIIRIRNEKKS